MRLSQRVSASVSAVAAMAAVAAGVALPASAAATGGSGGTWAAARQVRTPATQPQAGTGIVSDACAPKGYCAAVGTYWPAGRLGISNPYVVIDKNGSVGNLQHVNTAPLVNGPLSSHGDAEAEMDFVACPSAANCVALGDYNSFEFGIYPFVVNEKNGRWGKAHPIAGIAALGLAITATPTALACSSAGNCVAGGTFSNSTQPEDTVPFVVSEKDGVWGAAQTIPGLPSEADIDQGNILLACAPASCLGVGFYQGGQVNTEFVVSERGGAWGHAGMVPGLPKGSAPAMVSCSPDGTCTVAGYGSAAQRGTMFTIIDHKGVWGSESLVPGTAITGQNYNLNAISCPAAGDCSIGGWHTNARNQFTPWVAAEHGGHWSKADDVPGLAALDGGLDSQLTTLACATVGNCAAGGLVNVHVTRKTIRIEAFVVSEAGGKWGKGILVPGIVKLDGDGNSDTSAIACATASHCIAGGDYEHNGKFSLYTFISVER